MNHQNYQGGGFEIFVRCTGNGKRGKKHRADFGRIVFATSPFNDSPFGDTVRESWAVDGGWIGLLGIGIERHKDGSFRNAKTPALQIVDPPVIEGITVGNGVKVHMRCPVCGCNVPLSAETLNRIVAERVQKGCHILDISLSIM